MENTELNYKQVDFNTWKRADKFKYFLNVEKSIINVTCNVDVTEFTEKCRESGLKFYSAFICLVSYVLNSHEYFRFGYGRNGDVVIYDSIKPFYTDSTDDVESFNCIVTNYSPDMKKLYADITADRGKYKGRQTLDPENIADNIFSITALPWIHYSQLSLNDASRPDSLAPAIAIGKYELHEGRLMMPLTLWIHHAVCDGYHVGRFYIEIQEMMHTVLYKIIEGRN